MRPNRIRQTRLSRRIAPIRPLVAMPPVTSNLYAWYDASAVNGLFAANPATDGTALASWKDLSGNGRDLSQATSANQPLFRNASRNLLTYNQGATCEDGTTTGFGTVSSNSSIAASTTQSAYGAWSLAGTCVTTAGDYRFGCTINVGEVQAVQPNTVYTATASTRANATVRNARVVIRWLTSSYSPSTTSQSAYVVNSVSSWTDHLVTATSPSDAAYARVYVEIGSAALNEIHYADKFGLFAGTVSTWTPPITLLNNQPTVQFDGNLQAMTRSSTTLAQPFTIYAVHKAESLGNTSTSADRAIVSMTNANMSVIRGGGSAPGRPYAYAGSLFPTVTGTTVTNASVLSYVYDNTSQSFRVNGSAGTAANAGSGGLSGVLGIGGGGSTHSGVMGGVNTVLIYSAAHDTTTRQSIERWLGARYGITVA